MHVIVGINQSVTLLKMISPGKEYLATTILFTLSEFLPDYEYFINKTRTFTHFKILKIF